MTSMVRFSIPWFSFGPRHDLIKLSLLAKHSEPYHSDSDTDFHNFMQNLETRYRAKMFAYRLFLENFEKPQNEPRVTNEFSNFRGSPK